MKHIWINRRRTWGSWRSECSSCGITRHQRFAGPMRWTEYDRDGETIASTADHHPVPACKPPAQAAE
jgi:hypothetical protein